MILNLFLKAGTRAQSMDEARRHLGRPRRKAMKESRIAGTHLEAGPQSACADPFGDVEAHGLRRRMSPRMGWTHGGITRMHGWPIPPADGGEDTADAAVASPRSPTPAHGGQEEAPWSEQTRREVLDSLRWRLEAEKSVKIGEELQNLVLQQQHEISDLRAQLDAQPPPDDRVSTLGECGPATLLQTHADTGQQLQKDLRQALRDNEALGRRAVAEEERADRLAHSLRAAEQTTLVAEQERRAMSSKIDELARLVADVKGERDAATAQADKAELRAKAAEEQAERAETLLQAEKQMHTAQLEAGEEDKSRLRDALHDLESQMSTLLEEGGRRMGQQNGEDGPGGRLEVLEAELRGANDEIRSLQGQLDRQRHQSTAQKEEQHVAMASVLQELACLRAVCADQDESSPKENDESSAIEEIDRQAAETKVQLESLRTQYELLQQSYADQSESHKAVQKANHDLLEANAALKVKSEALNKENAALGLGIEAGKEETAGLKEEREALWQERAMLKEELGVLKLENEDLRSARQQQLERFGELSHEQDAMKDNLTSLHIQHREALALAHQNHDAERMALKEAMELVQVEASAARTEIASLTQELQLAQETESGLLAELQGMVNALQDSLAASQQELTTYKDKTKSLQDVCISLRAEWEAVMSECENMRDERDSLRQERDALAKQMHSRGAEAVQLQSLLEEVGSVNVVR